MQTLSIDIETYSGADLKKSGVYRYAQDKGFSILLFGYAFDDQPVQLIDLACGEVLPEFIKLALQDEQILKTAHNANFERTCIAQYTGIPMPPEQWECTMVKSAMLGLPLSLDAVSKVLHLEQQKAASGKALIRYFTVPCKPTKVNGMRLVNLPEHDTEKWTEFRNYCIQDVEVERAIRNRISFFEIPEQEKQLWYLDQHINDNGVLLDLPFINNAIQIDAAYKTRLTDEAVALTGLDNPNSAAQLKNWIGTEMGGTVTALTKEEIPALLIGTDSMVVKRVLNIRQEMAKTSVKKYTAMVDAICTDNRLRGLIQFYGAGRTGRFAGRIVQPHNLPGMTDEFLKSVDIARAIVAAGDGDCLEMVYENVPDTLSQLIRTAFVAPEGYHFKVSDFSSIEARIIAWLAGERWRLEVFKTHGKIYEASAAQMFKVPIESITKTSPLRKKGKVSELALGYQGGPNALIKMGALKMGLQEEELPKLVNMWRNANKAIVKLWDDTNAAAIKCVETGESVFLQFGIRFFIEKGILFIQLPSGRKLAHMRPKLKPSKFGGNSLTYEGMNQTTKQWQVQDTYGGKLVENIVQAIARDCLAEAMLRITKAGYNIALHVHDEIVLEVPDGFGSLDEVNAIMGTDLLWAKGLPLSAESYETTYYKKD